MAGREFKYSIYATYEFSKTSKQNSYSQSENARTVELLLHSVDFLRFKLDSRLMQGLLS
jgi:hypothetical protein